MNTININSRNKKNNKLILLGNGFDLAHGLKTGYKDFINWYLNKVFHSDQGYYNDEIIKFQITSHTDRVSGILKENIPSTKKITKFISCQDIKLEFKSKFLECLIEQLNTNKWIDIEQFYYDTFKNQTAKIINNQSSFDNKFRGLIKLNSNLSEISNQLKIYLQENSNLEKSNHINQFKELIYSSDSQLIINFNYTNTVKEYLNQYDYPLSENKIIPLHGTIDEEEVPIVFGFGDERDKMYQDIEDLNENSIMDHFKSFAYLRNQNYSKLLSFIDSNPFDVLTIGLSCGLSDRTLLSQVFEHNNCKKIEIMYYKDENGYQDVARNISRHFSDKQELRRKLVNFEDSIKCPQYENND